MFTHFQKICTKRSPNLLLDMSGSMGSSAGVGAGVDLKDSDEVIFSVVHLKLTHSGNHFFPLSDIMEFNRYVGI